MKYVKWFEELGKEDVGIAGGKGANLGELTKAGIPVPPGFVVLSTAYFDFLEANELRSKIHAILDSLDVNDPQKLNEASVKTQKLLNEATIPQDMAREFIEAYHLLSEKQQNPQIPVAVRSSATAEDLPEASFAGQQESYLNIVGDANLILKIKDCWLSLFGERSIFYRQEQKFDHFKVGIAVPVQAMVQSEVSGVMFTVDPISQDKNKLVIEAVWGLGDYIVQGVVTPDHFEIDKENLKIISKNISNQEVMEVRSDQGVKEISVDQSKRNIQKISDEHVLSLAAIGKKIQQHYMFPQDIEWAFEKNTVYITQARPITTLKEGQSQSTNVTLEEIIKGAPASPGLVSGPVRIVSDIKEIGKVQPGDVLVTDMTTPDFVPAMRRATAIITNRGGLTSHAAIVSRELGVPCVVGTTTATKVLKEGMIVTVNGHSGQIYKGGLPKNQQSLPNDNPIPTNTTNLETATKLYVNLGEPDLAEKISKHNVDGVGLLRAEFMIAGIGEHPKKMISEGRGQQFIDKLAEDIAKICQAFSPRPVVYRATDFKTNEYRALKGGDLYEPVESNPMLGFRGALRYITNPDVFNLELEAIKKVRNVMGLKNLNLMIPFVSTVDELIEVKKIVATSGLYRAGSFKLWMMVEIPANVILLDKFIEAGIDGVSIGSNDLTMLILGADRDNSEVAKIFDERNEAVLWAIERTIKTALKHGITCGICGQAPTQYPELVEKLVEWGITSISVNPDAIERTRQIINHSEVKLIKKLSSQ